MNGLASSLGYSFGSVLLPFALSYWTAHKSIEPRLNKMGTLAAYALAWACQLFVVLLVGESAVVTVPSAFVFSFVALTHIATLRVRAFAGVSDGSIARTKTTWWRFYIRLFCLYVPMALLLGVAFGLISTAAGLEQHARLVGALAQLLASIYAAYFSFKWSIASHEA